jgi:ribosome maturation protein Sdo1
VDPKLKTPHPIVRIENAFTTLKIKIDPDVSTDRQVLDIAKRLPEVLPIKKVEPQDIAKSTSEDDKPKGGQKPQKANPKGTTFTKNGKGNYQS